MDETLNQQFVDATNRLTTAAIGLENLLSRLDAQHQELSSKVDRIVAAIEESHPSKTSQGGAPTEVTELQAHVAELERTNAELKAQAARAGRKTLSPLTTAVLAKNEGDALDTAALDKALASLSVDQRIAVKAEMARAGIIE